MMIFKVTKNNNKTSIMLNLFNREGVMLNLIRHLCFIWIPAFAGMTGILLIMPLATHAASSISVTPVVIDLKAKTRDIIKETITVRNSGSYKTNIYVFVNNIAPKEGTQGFVSYQESDKTTSLANWIEITRGVIELGPGEERTLDMRIDIHPEASAGVRHAMIAFSEGSTRKEAGDYLTSGAQVAINLEVVEDIKERLQLRKFVSDKTFFTSFPITFSYEIENIGNREQLPHGTIRIYNRRGEEVAEVTANDGKAALEPDANKLLASAWQGGEGSLLGKYKAVLDLEYGSKGTATLQDTIFFWVVPWQLAGGVFATLMALAVALAFAIHAMYERRYAHVHVYHSQQQIQRAKQLTRPAQAATSQPAPVSNASLSRNDSASPQKKQVSDIRKVEREI